MTDTTRQTGEATEPLRSAAFLLGFAASGFFDGVLLHQILQWHHLLGAIEGDVAFQVAADGWFHAAMYAIAAVGAWFLWRARRALGARDAGRTVAAWGLIGFGAWHGLDAVLAHWVLGLHRIRMDAALPLAWDLGWLAVFGLLPLGAGLALRRGGTGSGGRTAALGLVLGTVALGGWAMRPAPGPTFTAIAFAPWVTTAEAATRTMRVSERLVDMRGGVFVVAGLAPGAAFDLYRDGAIYVGTGPMPAGCVSWTR
ncbi:DUF2243 domain-containing protein [Jannaschia sp. LMIT008]|uniref:DUF2243 domain-containing protein n=1 Tax=Jannaschia maritima TaxID=3032585 RepID=UPI00281282C1|nr:DUF2243 domain-containing protein [Jannaschia sp. LMIT008]